MNFSLKFQSRNRSIGGFQVRRVLPFAKKRMIGPFIFIDHMGPVSLEESSKLDVRPHPHIGLSTVTYLLSGRGLHKDSLGTEMIIEPGDINWMTAGSGIAHCEYTPQTDLITQSTLEGLQIWVALPQEFEDQPPSFNHTNKKDLPEIHLNNVRVKVLLGEFMGYRSPVPISSQLVYVDFVVPEGETLAFECREKEFGLYVLKGMLQAEDETLQEGEFAVGNSNRVQLKAIKPTRLVLVGGEPFPEERFIWWNFVSSSKEKIKQAALQWAEQKFPKVPGETEWVPLPGDRLP